MSRSLVWKYSDVGGDGSAIYMQKNEKTVEIEPRKITVSVFWQKRRFRFGSRHITNSRSIIGSELEFRIRGKLVQIPLIMIKLTFIGKQSFYFFQGEGGKCPPCLCQRAPMTVIARLKLDQQSLDTNLSVLVVRGTVSWNFSRVIQFFQRDTIFPT